MIDTKDICDKLEAKLEAVEAELEQRLGIIREYESTMQRWRQNENAKIKELTARAEKAEEESQAKYDQLFELYGVCLEEKEQLQAQLDEANKA